MCQQALQPTQAQYYCNNTITWLAMSKFCAKYVEQTMQLYGQLSKWVGKCFVRLAFIVGGMVVLKLPIDCMNVDVFFQLWRWNSLTVAKTTAVHMSMLWLLTHLPLSHFHALTLHTKKTRQPILSAFTLKQHHMLVTDQWANKLITRRINQSFTSPTNTKQDKVGSKNFLLILRQFL